MKLFTLSASLVPACLLLVEEAGAFTAPKPNQRIAWQRGSLVRRGGPSILRVAAGEYKEVSDVQEAVQLVESMNEKDNDAGIQVNNEPFEPTAISKEELLNDVRETMEAEPLVVLPDPEAEMEEEPEADEEEVACTSMETAGVSASLYMNPATAKIAQRVKITWEPDVAETLSRLEKVANPNRPFMVGIVGIPGSGKSTSAEIIQAILGEDRCMILPMDGFHIPLAELADLENAADAIYRRGAPDTFHAAALREELAKIAHGDTPQVSIPGFDHAVGDPTPDQHTFVRDTHRIVLCEGLYLLHDDDGWENMKSIFDWTIYIDANVDTCIERLKERNKCIPGYTPEEIEIRCDAVDRVNAETARDGAYKYASQIVTSGASSNLESTL